MGVDEVRQDDSAGRVDDLGVRRVDLFGSLGDHAVSDQHVAVGEIERDAGAGDLLIAEQDGRISNADLADRVGLSPSPCLRRIRRLEETGVIRGYQAVVDPAPVGRSLRVIAGVRLVRHARASRRSNARSCRFPRSS
ncbi:hypothetical protein GCM10011609_84560 [Lentzea pudingi]|uniref:HTH asnC-type domain-containing protein n=1 Tax=Lentzea pudingi TaxID=1789439 RepID=A0ABQ2IRV8_9PSEU|nr:hypothetical protein GCM10011609_84560 [Lentzea pudingi]